MSNSRLSLADGSPGNHRLTVHFHFHSWQDIPIATTTTRTTTSKQQVDKTLPSLPLLLLLILVSLASFGGAQQVQLPQPNVQPNLQFVVAPNVQPPPPAHEAIATLHHLEPPAHAHQQQPFVQGPDGLDLVAFNRRRFELDHHHRGGPQGTGPNNNNNNHEQSLRRGELIEAHLAAIPERLLSQLPDSMTQQLFESISADPALMLPQDGELGGSPLRNHDEDPDGASIERLTKSCLTVHASSATPEQLNVTFHLYTRKNPQVSYLLGPQISRLELLRATPFDPRLPVKWITHGFHTNLDKSEWMLEAKDKILAHEEANVILTDWRRGASPALAFYPKAAANAHIVAKMIVKILRRLRGDLNLSRVHLIGHSLGAHIMGFVGSAFTEEYLQLQQQQQRGPQNLPGSSRAGPFSQLIGRITACDPALPCFGPTSSAPDSRPPKPAVKSAEELMKQKQQQQQQPASLLSDWTPTMWTHLRPDSAIVVEVMHSNPGVMGYAEPLGDFDFYPNGLNGQPGCGASGSQSQNSKRSLGDGDGVDDHDQGLVHKRQLGKTLDRFIKPIRDFFSGNSCSHHRSVEYMVESLYYEHGGGQWGHRQVGPVTTTTTTTSSSNNNNICQMIGYRCQDYESFKRGFCFRCRNEYDCRAFSMSVNSLPTTDLGYAQLLEMQYNADGAPAGGGGPTGPRGPRSLEWPADSNSEQDDLWWLMEKFNRRLFEADIDDQQQTVGKRSKRVLPTFNQYAANYKQSRRNQYYFDTRPAPNYCLHHYHLHVKYRWFRVRDSLPLDGFRLIGRLAVLEHSASQQSQSGAGAGQATGGGRASAAPAPLVQLHRFTMNSYTLLLTTQLYLGPLESLVVFGSAGLKASLIDYIEISYLSHLDAQVRASNSARLCLAPGAPANGGPNVNELFLQTGEPNAGTKTLSLSSSSSSSAWQAHQRTGGSTTQVSVFVRCSIPLVRR